DSTIDKTEEFVLEAQLYHNFTPKTSLNLVGLRRNEETTISTTDYVLTNSITASYIQRFTEKFSGTLEATYTNDKFEGDLTYGGVTKERKDDIYRIAPSVRYVFNDWLMAEFAYSYTERDSNFDDFNYTNNSVMLKITAGL
ncbi:MAG: outer membrane beta-barrel protein, partial [Deltaproteobacteria bacterium]|nr:outer membrane beta-barrel protein [Deltaproteobacteria bacterium]